MNTRAGGLYLDIVRYAMITRKDEGTIEPRAKFGRKWGVTTSPLLHGNEPGRHLTPAWLVFELGVIAEATRRRKELVNERLGDRDCLRFCGLGRRSRVRHNQKTSIQHQKAVCAHSISTLASAISSGYALSYDLLVNKSSTLFDTSERTAAESTGREGAVGWAGSGGGFGGLCGCGDLCL